MGNLCAVISCWLLIVGAVEAQSAQPQVNKRLLPQWLTGIIAVSGFLFLTFVVFLVKKAWCEESSGRTVVELERETESVMTNGNTYEISLNMVRSKDDVNVYENLAMDNADERVTVM